MSPFVDVLQPFVASGLFEVRGMPLRTLDDLIGKKASFYPSYQLATDSWVFDFRDRDIVADFLAHDCGRFCCAAFQTFLEIGDELRTADRVPWAFIKAYYASYYAAHGLLRILGTTCTYIDGQRASVLSRVLAAYAVSSQVGGGLYSLSIATPSGASMAFRALGARSGGTHDQLWSLFNTQLAGLAQDILTSVTAHTEAQHVFAKLETLRAVLSLKAKDSWLSNVRNAIQYRQDHGVWYFDFGLTKRDLANLSKLAAGWSKDPLSLPLDKTNCGELGAFLAACTFLVASLRSLIVRIGELGRRGRQESFVWHGPIRFLKTRKLMP